MSRFTVTPLPLEGLCVVERKAVEDERGFLSRVFCADELREAGWSWPVSQINHAMTKVRGTVRGMHFQSPPVAEAKLVSCIRGAVWDVAVDLRRDSPTFLQWHAEELSAANQRALLIPPGFAHGFQALSNHCQLVYIHSQTFSAHHEAGINPCDPLLCIQWPLAICNLSRKDSSHAFLQPTSLPAFPMNKTRI
jgi:dTDP-4-dehydrorhamnose 3,5-epimerase